MNEIVIVWCYNRNRCSVRMYYLTLLLVHYIARQLNLGYMIMNNLVAINNRKKSKERLFC